MGVTLQSTAYRIRKIIGVIIIINKQGFYTKLSILAFDQYKPNNVNSPYRGTSRVARENGWN